MEMSARRLTPFSLLFPIIGITMSAYQMASYPFEIQNTTHIVASRLGESCLRYFSSIFPISEESVKINNYNEYQSNHHSFDLILYAFPY